MTFAAHQPKDDLEYCDSTRPREFEANLQSFREDEEIQKKIIEKVLFAAGRDGRRRVRSALVHQITCLAPYIYETQRLYTWYHSAVLHPQDRDFCLADAVELSSCACL